MDVDQIISEGIFQMMVPYFHLPFGLAKRNGWTPDIVILDIKAHQWSFMKYLGRSQQMSMRWL